MHGNPTVCDQLHRLMAFADHKRVPVLYTLLLPEMEAADNTDQLELALLHGQAEKDEHSN